MRSIPALLFVAALAAPTVRAENLMIVADRDGTLIEDPAGMAANGAGPGLFAGRTSQPQDSIRRAVVHFDVRDVPKGAVIESARLKLYVSQANPGANEMSVHALLADWGEGASFSNGGSGAPAEPGDATWIHRFFDPAAPSPPASPRSARTARSLWIAPGSDFASEASATLVVPGIGFQVFSGPRLTADVVQWLKKPKRNFGWIVIGDEGAPSTARRFESRQGMLPDFHPRLEITYRRK